MKLHVEKQVAPISSEVLARISIIRPILTALLAGVKREVLEEQGGAANVKLFMLPRVYRQGSGDVGFCFEWAIHDAIQHGNPMVMERLESAGRLCRLPGNTYKSILFGLEKTGKTRIIDTANNILTNDSRILTGTQSQPPKLKSYINRLRAAFNRPSTRMSLPTSINGLWKADLFFGTTDGDRWLGTTLKINPNELESGKGLRIGIVPCNHGTSDRVRKDDSKNIIICPIPYDGSFMELFYTGWRIVQQFIAADANMPQEAALPTPADRQAVKELVIRRDFPLVDVVNALEAQAQSDLLDTSIKTVSSLSELSEEDRLTELIITPKAMPI